MNGEISLKYGDQVLKVDLGYEFQVLNPGEIGSIHDVETELNECLKNPIDSKPFEEIFSAGDKVVIVASDVTRLWAKQSSIIHPVINRLNEIGIPDDDILILIATGTHRKQTEEEKKKIVGEGIYERIKVTDHDCDNSDMVNLGKTGRGTEVEINRLVVERKVILLGGIVHHLMSGFGGGRKSIIPGVASRKTIFQNHIHALDPDAERSNPLIGVGVIDNNPIHEDMVECTEFVKPDFLINTIINPKGEIAKIVAGDWLTAWEEGCRWADEKFGVPIDEKADIVVASCGGFPKDISLYQSTKTLFNAGLAVKSGGTVLLLAECREGAGADAFFSWVEPLKQGKLDSELREKFTIAGYIFYAAVEVAKKCNVVLLSSLESSLVEPMGIAATTSIQEALELSGIYDADKKVMVMPYGGNTIPLYNK